MPSKRKAVYTPKYKVYPLTTDYIPTPEEKELSREPLTKEMKRTLKLRTTLKNKEKR